MAKLLQDADFRKGYAEEMYELGELELEQVRDHDMNGHKVFLNY